MSKAARKPATWPEHKACSDSTIERFKVPARWNAQSLTPTLSQKGETESGPMDRRVVGKINTQMIPERRPRHQTVPASA
ncbi:hypothetical protein GCM10011496_00040 [Polaromonas eurypsychrophila]|uniref:Uncharacterized protein n=1 Tax=Polaromonas eurypsychrophila TaxID=1614635 RepID=A0A916S591_9BURK|nr:hypothetical protein GCM10011496_00040 [Polaromonas eurypsychrophila]